MDNVSKIYCPKCDENIFPDYFTYIDYDIQTDEKAIYHEVKVSCDHCGYQFSLYMQNLARNVRIDEEIHGEGMMLDREED